MESNSDTSDVTLGGDASDWLNESFIETILQKNTGNSNVHVRKIEIESFMPVGENFMSVMKRVSVEYLLSKVTEKCSLIVKTLPVGEFMLKVIRQMNVFFKEIHMYRVTLPAMYQLANEKLGGDQERLTAKSYHCSRPDTLILEDLKPLGYRTIDRRQQLDLNHSALALRTLAKFHGMSIALHAKDPTAMDAFVESIFTEENRENQTEFLGRNLFILAKEVRTWQGFEKYGDKLYRISQSVVDRAMELVKFTPGRMRVLNHGDLWTNNIMYRYHSDGTISDVMLLDFQMTRFGSPALDIIYFIYTSPTQQVLEDHREEMLEQYHDALCDTMRKMGCDQDLFISLDQLHQEMEDKAFYAVIVSVYFGMMISDPEDAPKLSNLTKEDMESGMDTMSRLFGGKKFREVFQKRLRAFESQGLI